MNRATRIVQADARPPLRAVPSGGGRGGGPAGDFRTALRAGLLGLLLLAALWPGLAAPALAQDGDDPIYSDRQLLTFAQVKLELDRINADYSARIADARDDDEELRLVEEANALSLRIIQESTITFGQYSRILARMQNDEGLRGRIRFLMRELEAHQVP